ncbi:MAG: DHH family phosphoesterase [Thermofilaceae archaeon]
MDSYRDFEKALSTAADVVESAGGRSALLISHYDADGLSAASIVTSTLIAKGFAVHVLILEHPTQTALSRLERVAQGYPLILTLDMGSSALPAFSRLKTKVLVLDHHLPEEKSEEVIEVNPHRFKINGSFEISSSGLAYLLAKELEGERAVKYAPLAVVGALGDRQDVGKRFRLTGLNEEIVREGINAKLLEERIELRITGVKRPLVKSLAYTLDPFLPGITGDEGGALSFLKSIGIEPTIGEKFRTLNDLNIDERKKLASELIKRLIGMGYSVTEAERIYGATYVVLSEPEDSPLHDAREYAQLLNASGRLGFHDLALAVGLGARGETLLRAVEIAGQYRAMLAKAFKCVKEENLLKESTGYAIADLRGKSFLNEKISGAIASILSLSIKGDKLLFVFVDSPEGVKVSVRKCGHTKLNVGELLSRLAGEAGGTGGGHENAGGATVPANSMDRFLTLISKEVSGR